MLPAAGPHGRGKTRSRTGPGAAGLRLGLAGLFAALATLATFAAESARAEDALALSTLSVAGRPLQVFAVAEEGARGAHLVVVSVTGRPPDERRRVSIFAPAPGTSGPYAPEPGYTLEVPRDVVAVDVADLRPAPGPEVLLLSAWELRFAGPGLAGVERARRFEPPLPLPPASRGLSRLPFMDGTGPDGARAVLVPSLRGIERVPLSGGPGQTLRAPVLSEYLPFDANRVETLGFLFAEITWPELGVGDDDGDGESEIFVLSRYELSVYGADGARRRQVALRPFTAEEELRHETTWMRLFAEDLDGDGLSDLVLHRTVGTLMRSTVSTSVYRNAGSGADPSGKAVAELSGEGFGAVLLEDLDGDGRVELIQTVVPFGVIQAVRMLVTRSVEAKLRVYQLAEPGLGAAVRAWEGDLGIKLDFDQGRQAGLLPRVDGDWNGDGRLDLVYGTGKESIAFRLGEAKDKGPGFGGRTGQQDVPSAEEAFVHDLDGDGLDDLVAYDPRDGEGRIYVLRNRGLLPGTPTSLRSQ